MGTCGHQCCPIPTNGYHVHLHAPADCWRCTSGDGEPGCPGPAGGAGTGPVIAAAGGWRHGPAGRRTHGEHHADRAGDPGELDPSDQGEVGPVLPVHPGGPGHPGGPAEIGAVFVVAGDRESAAVATLVADVLTQVAPHLPGLPDGPELVGLVASVVVDVHAAALLDPDVQALDPEERRLVLAGRAGLALAFPPERPLVPGRTRHP